MAELLTQVQRQGDTAVLMTITLPHYPGQSLRSVWDALQTALRSMTSGRAFQAWKEVTGYRGMVKSVEVTWSQGRTGNSWNPHAHLVLVMQGQPDDTELMTNHVFLMRRFNASLVRQGWSGTTDIVRSTDWQRIQPDDADRVASYVSGDRTTGAAAEMTLSQFKNGSLTSLSTWALAQAVVELGLSELYRCWVEWCQASERRKGLTFSRGLRERYGVHDEVSDEEATVEREVVQVASCSAEQWHAYVRQGRQEQLVRDTARLRAWELLVLEGWLVGPPAMSARADTWGLGEPGPDEYPPGTLS